MKKENRFVACLGILFLILTSLYANIANAAYSVESTESVDSENIVETEGAERMDTVPVVTEDNLRIRYGLGSVLGSVFALNDVVLGPGLRAQLGLQFNNSVSLYVQPSAKLFIFGGLGIDITLPVLLEYTLPNNKLSFGFGPELGIFLATSDDFGSGAAGGTFGGHGFIAVNKSPKVSENGRRENWRFGLGISVFTFEFENSFVRGDIFLEYPFY